MESFWEMREKWNCNKDISKWDFADLAMSRYHSLLFDYANAIRTTDIQRIVIENSRVYFEINGIKLSVRENDARSMPMDILNFGSYEKEQMDMIDQILSIINPSSILDIGGNIGYTSCYWGMRYPHAKIEVYEPIPATYEMLCNNINLNGLDNVLAHNKGLSDKSGVAKFYYYPWCTANTSINNLQHRNDAIQLECTLSTIDEEKYNSIDFMKCDVEGNELSVLIGGSDTIRNTLPVISIEILRKYSAEFGYNANDVVNVLNNIGYQMYITGGKKLYQKTSIDEETMESNFIFLHPIKHKTIVDKICHI